MAWTYPHNTMSVVTDGTPKLIELDKLENWQIILAIQIGIAELVHSGKVRIDDIRA